MPSKLREDLGVKFIVTRGIGSCLYVFSLEEWQNFSSKLKSLPLTDRSAQDFLRMLFASACECEPDKQGRILLPQRLRDHAHISGEAVVIGVMSRVEIWSKEDWAKYNERSANDYDETLKQLSLLGI
jgi:MraZ protein